MNHTHNDVKCCVTFLLRYLGTEAYTIIANYKEAQAGFPIINQSGHCSSTNEIEGKPSRI